MAISKVVVFSDYNRKTPSKIINLPAGSKNVLLYSGAYFNSTVLYYLPSRTTLNYRSTASGNIYENGYGSFYVREVLEGMHEYSIKFYTWRTSGLQYIRCFSFYINGVKGIFSED